MTWTQVYCASGDDRRRHSDRGHRLDIVGEGPGGGDGDWCSPSLLAEQWRESIRRRLAAAAGRRVVPTTTGTPLMATSLL